MRTADTVNRDHKIIRTSAAIMVLLALSKLLNFLKYVLIGRYFGAAGATDCFFVAFSVPAFINIFTESFLFFAFIPVFTDFIVCDKNKEASDFFAAILGIISLISLVVTFLLLTFSFNIASLIAPGFSYANKIIVSKMLRILSLMVILGSLAGLFRAINSVYRRYFISVFGGILETATAIGVLVIFAPIIGIFGLIFAVLSGAFIMFLVQVMPVIIKDSWLRLRLKFSRQHILKSLSLAAAIVLIWIIHHLSLVAMNAFASNFGTGSVSALYYSRTIAQVIPDCLGLTILISIFPVFARQASSQERGEFSDTFLRSLWLIILISIPTSIFLALNNTYVVSIVFKGSSFDIASVRDTALALSYFSIGIIGLGLDQLVLQSLVALKEIKTAIILTCSKVTIITILYFILSRYLGFIGLALAFSCGLIINSLFSLYILRLKSVFFAGPGLFNKLLKTLVAVLPAVFVFKFFASPGRDYFLYSQFQVLIRLILSFSLGGLVYLLMLSLLKIEEVTLYLNPVKFFPSVLNSKK